MPISYELKKERGYVLVVTSGILQRPEKEFFEYVKKIVNFCISEKEKLVLLDVRNVNGIDSLEAKRYLADWIANNNVSEIIKRMACVQKPSQLSRFMETMLRDRGFHYRIFHSFEEAEKWLLFK
jgi:hypothetical protein